MFLRTQGESNDSSSFFRLCMSSHHLDYLIAREVWSQVFAFSFYFFSGVPFDIDHSTEKAFRRGTFVFTQCASFGILITFRLYLSWGRIPDTSISLPFFARQCFFLNWSSLSCRSWNFDLPLSWSLERNESAVKYLLIQILNTANCIYMSIHDKVTQWNGKPVIKFRRGLIRSQLTTLREISSKLVSEYSLYYTKMDSKLSSFVLHKENSNHTSCKLCSKVDSNSLKILNCLHVFCEACLKKFIVENSVICPQCGRRMQLGDQGINGLPSHEFYDRVKDIQNCGQWIEQRRDAFCWEM